MSDTLRSGLIRLAFANPSLRADLLPLIEKEAAGKKQDKVRAVNEKGTVVWVNKDTLRKQPGKFKPYKHEEDEGKGGGAEKSEGKESGGGGKTKSPIPVKMYEYIGPDAVVIGKSIKDGVSLPPKKSETVLGVLERAIAGVKSGKDSADPTVLKHYKSLAKHLKGEVDKRNKALVKHPQSVRDIANEHDLPAVDVAEVQAQAKSLADKNAKSRKSPEQRKQEFLKNIDPSKYSPKELAAMKERIKKMSAGDFEKMVFALAEDEGGGKTASLRSGLIRLAYANPSLRPTLLPLIAKHAGEMDAELEEDADPTSHDQNLPEHYYFNKGAAGKGESVEAILKQFASPASKNQNKPESYYGLAPKGKQAAVNPQGAVQMALLAYFKDMPVGTTEELGDVHRHPSFRLVEFGRLMSAAKALAKKGVFKWDGSAVTKIASLNTSRAAAKEKNDYSPDTGETGKLRDDLVKALKKKGLEVEEGSSANTLYIDGEKVAIHGPHLEGEHVKEWVRKPSRKEWLDEAVKLLGKKASVMTAAAKAPAKLKGKKLDEAISKAYYKHGNNVQVDIMNIGKIYAAGKSAYEGAGTLEEADQALDEAMKAAIAKYRVN
jgi:hypothetical protein